MIPGFLLSLREGLEAALIIGIVVGGLQKIGRSNLMASLWIGVFSAVILSLLSALLLNALGAELEGKAEEIFEGTTMLLAAGVLTWMIYWMRRQSRGFKSRLEGNVQKASSYTGKGALFLLSFASVLREGIELALLLTAASLTSSGIQTILGALLGLLVACILGYLLFASTIRLNLTRFFQLTALLLILFAAGLVSHSVHEFNEAGLIPTIIAPIWNLNSIMDDHSVVGMLLGTLFGYNGDPSLTEVLAYIIYMLGVYALFQRIKFIPDH